MKLTQDYLRDQQVRRIRAQRPELADQAERAGLLSARTELTADDGEAGVLAVCVVRRLDLGTWIRGACAYSAALSPGQGQAWSRAFTRTAFLAGDPGNLAGRFSFAHVSEDGAAAWTAPDQAGASSALRRLLKVFQARQGLWLPAGLTVRVPGEPAGDRPPHCRGLYLAMSDLPLGEAMVHIHHLLAEAVLGGLVRPGDVLTVRQVPRLGGLTRPLEAVRAGADPDAPGRLRAFAGLTTGP